MRRKDTFLIKSTQLVAANPQDHPKTARKPSFHPGFPSRHRRRARTAPSTRLGHDLLLLRLLVVHGVDLRGPLRRQGLDHLGDGPPPVARGERRWPVWKTKEDPNSRSSYHGMSKSVCALWFAAESLVGLYFLWPWSESAGVTGKTTASGSLDLSKRPSKDLGVKFISTSTTERVSINNH